MVTKPHPLHRWLSGVAPAPLPGLQTRPRAPVAGIPAAAMPIPKLVSHPLRGIVKPAAHVPPKARGWMASALGTRDGELAKERLERRLAEERGKLPSMPPDERARVEALHERLARAREKR